MTHDLLRATFQLIPGLRATREQRLWAGGITDWAHLEGAAPGLLPLALRPALLRAAAQAERALDRGDLSTLAALLPVAERWRLFGAFAEEAVYLDIETDLEDGISAIGLLGRDGPRLLLGRALARLPDEVPPTCLLVTFNGASFDVPVLRRAFPHWRPPVAHVDLRPVLGRLGQRGGLKAIEEQTGLARPDHLRGLDGRGAAGLYRLGRGGDRAALRRFAEYNLYDTVNLRTLMGLAYNQLAARLGPGGAPAERCRAAWMSISSPVAVSHRGDVLYDVSKILLAL